MENIKTKLREFFKDRTIDPDYITEVNNLIEILDELQKDQFNNWKNDIKELKTIITILDTNVVL